MDDSALLSSEGVMRHSFALLIACHNRRQKTLTFLDEFLKAWPSSHPLSITLLDDGSTDGTATAVSVAFPTVKIETGTGSLFWNGAMSRLVTATLRGPDRHVILANDDVRIFAGALSPFVDSYLRLNERSPAVLVGAFKDATTNEITYSGFRKIGGLSPLAVTSVKPTGRLEPCDSFNANLVIVPNSKLRQVGGLDSAFTHGFGDLDLGYRLARAGVQIFVHGTPVGTCSRNPVQDRASFRSLSLRQRWFLNFRKVNVAADYRRFVRKHAPLISPLLIMKDATIRFCRSVLPAL